ncbi:hypothetical protein TRVA0_047S00848 [Trichomonascus vanleenenianus]|uniref:arrestin family protein n=1 Tax=Trichomonascus vanleenenianus TaxID=2268995 RepID=UPI003ECAA2BA
MLNESMPIPFIGSGEPTSTTSDPHRQDDHNIVLSSTHTAVLSLNLTESHIFLLGLTRNEMYEQESAILRGSLVLRVLKPTKVKSIMLRFKGTAKTEWPEGIPPLKVDILEDSVLHMHEWDFFDASSPLAEYSSGAHLVKFDKTGDDEACSDESGSSTPLLGPITKGITNLLRGKTNIQGYSQVSHTPFESNDSSLVGLPDLSLGPHRSFSKEEKVQGNTNSRGYRVFKPGKYVYNFELPLPSSLPETIDAPYGSVKYVLEASVDRVGAFTQDLHGIHEIPLIRGASYSNVEASEPITLHREWDERLSYDVIIHGKLFPIGGDIPVSFRLQPLKDDVRLHRIRFYVSENVDYYCRNRKVHRIEPAKRYLVKEFTAGSIEHSLLNDSKGQTDLDYSIHIPKKFTHAALQNRVDFRRNKDLLNLHPDTTYGNIKSHHWIKVVMRISKHDEEHDRRKFFEISIESPITFLHPECTTQNMVLPNYYNVCGGSNGVRFARHGSVIGTTLFSEPPPPYNPPPDYTPAISRQLTHEAVSLDDDHNSSDEEEIVPHHSNDSFNGFQFNFTTTRNKHPQPPNRTGPRDPINV